MATEAVALQIQENMNLLRRCANYFRPHWAGTCMALFLMLIANALSLLRPWPLALLLDQVLGTKSSVTVSSFLTHYITQFDTQQIILWLAIAVIALQAIWGFFQFFHTWILVKIGLRVLLKLRADLYSALQNLSLKFHDARRSGDSTFRVTYDTQSIQTLYNRGFITILSAAISLILMFLIMWRCSWKLTLVSLAVTPLLIWTIYYFANRIRQESIDVQQGESNVLAKAQEGLTSVRIVQAFGRQRHEVRQFIHECEQSLSANLRLTFTNVSSSFVVGFITALGTACLFYVGSHQVLSGEISIGTFVLFTSYLVMLYQPLEQLSYTGWAVAGATAGLQRVFEILDMQDDIPDAPQARPLPSIKGHIKMENVAFGYEPNHPVLQNVTFKIEAGKTVAFVGGTGAGKSTLLSLIPRFYEPQQGTIEIDAHNIRDVTKRSLRAQISLVLQDTLLLSTTVRENIAYGKLRATQEQIIEAAQAAQAHDFIMSLPQGYDTPVGERGVRLSGGQRQRIGIARAFLKDAPILLLDEPTSALDAKTESEIMDALTRLMQGRTTLIVTHRLATIHQVDHIYVLEKGQIVESGNGPELLAKNGVYSSLWRSLKN
ncbi:MAG: ABC transporter ATP-binding protein/permease [Verrucomicrobiae bacterium]|nr:ABC transporter ATP-binding protein/permease [Verrucomicrobiae bacterium]